MLIFATKLAKIPESTNLPLFLMIINKGLKVGGGLAGWRKVINFALTNLIEQLIRCREKPNKLL